MFDEYALREQFPLLKQTIHNHPLVYLDSAATSQKPQSVIDAEREYYETMNASVHRGAHELAALSTTAFEESRVALAQLINAAYAESEEEIVFTSGATAGLNLLATSLGYASMKNTRSYEPEFALSEKNNIVVSQAEHHSVLLPMQELCARTGAQLRHIPLDEQGRLRTDELDGIIDENTKFVAITHISNVTGAISPVEEIVKVSHGYGAYVILDACQSLPHVALDVKKTDVDFAAWSVHKMYGPTGVGCLYGKRELLEKLPPSFMGGSMVQLAWLDQPARYMDPPARFEAGTQPVAQIVAAGVAARWIKELGFDAIEAHEHKLVDHILKLNDIEGIRILGPTENKDRIGTVAFEVEGVHPHDVGQFFDSRGIAIRVGHHCAQPVHRHFGVYASNRVSCGVYNTVEEVEEFIETARQVRQYFLR